MFNISDIFSNKSNKGPEDKPGQDKGGFDLQQPKETKGMNILAAVGKVDATADGVRANELYQEALIKAKEIYRSDFEKTVGFSIDISAVVAKLADALRSGNREFLRLSLSDYADRKEYLAYHALNVCILALDIGLGLKLETQALKELGEAGFLHDIGEIRYLNLINKAGKLTEDEYIIVKEHPQKGAEILSRFGKEISYIVIDAIKQEHERIDGSGYPLGLKENTIVEYAQIIGLVDVYEAMTHVRPYRVRFTPEEAIKYILEHKNAFDYKIIKALIERVGIFPVGALVRLNTKEVGLVVKGNVRIPLRPVVSILLDAEGRQLENPRQVDLADNSIIYIEGCLKD